MKSIAVFFGGQSVEHDISVITGVMTINCIDKEKFNVLPVYVTQEGEWKTGESLFDIDEFKHLDLKKLKKVAIVGGDNTLYQVKGKKLKPIENIYCAINCLHGKNGEDGALAGLLSMSNISLASPNMLSSSISMDKSFTKLVLKSLNIKTLKSVTVTSKMQVKEVLKKLDFPLLVKPNFLGSSIGITKADDKEMLIEGIENALKYGESAIVEPFLSNVTEINCAVYRDEKGIINLSECEKPISRADILSFKDKYQDGKREFPANIEKKFSQKIKETAKKIYENLRFSGVIRIDFFIYDGEILVNEINSVPGSLSYYLFGDTKKSFGEMLTRLIMASERKYLRDLSFISEYNSGILTSFGSKGAKHL
ncbi:MAG: ATP-grasp domain-containing protein [Clostridia bacterium]|nr:ATP-grasp domain-containing protein [Clostridia bacterium]